MHQTITVNQAAAFLNISRQRVRYLLAKGRLVGDKDARGRWSIGWPLQLYGGRRGPDMANFPTRLNRNSKPR